MTFFQNERPCCSDCGGYITFVADMDLGLCSSCERADDEAWDVAVMGREEDEDFEYGNGDYNVE